MTATRYAWVMRLPLPHRALPPEVATTVPFVTCRRCGWQSKGRKKCPACHRRLEAANV